MEDALYTNVPAFRSRLSFLPLIEAWERCGQREKGTSICHSLATRFSAIQEFLEPADTYSFLEIHHDLIEESITTLFPVLMQEYAFYALVTPFSNKVIYASQLFRQTFMDGKNNYILPLDAQVENNILKARIHLAYKMILKKYYNHQLAGGDHFICAYPEPEQDIHRYFELSWDPQFIHVQACMELPELPEKFLKNCNHVEELVHYGWLHDTLPVDQFIFDGVLPITIKDVTQREAAARIKDLLQSENVLEDEIVFDQFREQLRYLLSDETLDTSILSFYGHPSLSGVAEQIFKFPDNNFRKDFEQFCQQQLENNDFYRTDNLKDDIFRNVFEKTGKKHAFIAGLYEHEQLCGVIGIFSLKSFAHESIPDLQEILPHIGHAVIKNHNMVQQMIDRVVKDHFTAVHSSVEWKFKETAVSYLLQANHGITEMSSINFQHVYPLYGAIDVRNSSGERNQAAEKDLLHQLEWAKSILLKSLDYYSFPLTEELLLRTDEWINLIGNRLFSAYEKQILDFLTTDISQMLLHLDEHVESLKGDILSYQNALDPGLLVLNRHQKEFEESISSINRLVAHRMDGDQAEAQAAFPHYFERFVSDGVECNLYIGQAISIHKKFNHLHLQNLRLWQLRTMASIGQALMELIPQLPVKLQTTQLILVYDQPISISFRAEERKFDVTGVYDSRYEVIKKRIDKSHVRDTGQRLTQPDMISVVYQGLQEEKEYESYFRFLKKQNLFEGEPEMVELEDMQGVSGLKAMRMKISVGHNDPEKEKTSKKVMQE